MRLLGGVFVMWLMSVLSCSSADVIKGYDGVAVNVSGATYHVWLDGHLLLKGEETPNPMLWGESLVLTNVSRGSGVDAHLGAYTHIDVNWTGAATIVTTTIKVFSNRPALLFETTYLATAKQEGAPASQDSVVSSFPKFLVAEGEMDLAQIAWNGNQLAGSNVSRWTRFWGGNDGGIPLLLFDEKLRAVMIGPYSNFMTSIHAKADDGLVFAAGVKGSIEEIPAGHTHQTLMYFGHSINQTVVDWGDCLLSRGEKQRVQYSDDFILSHLGYWTDHGAFYYHQHPGFENAEEALKAVKADAEKRDIPLRYFQWDDWWYSQAHGDVGGLMEWQPLPNVFPSGMTTWLDTPLSLYVAMYNADNIYVKDYEFYFDTTNHSLPIDKRFYLDLFKNGTDIGMRMFEQDFFSTTNSATTLLNRNISIGNLWLSAMDDAAVFHNVTLQLCMMDPVHALQSSEMKQVTNGRGSKDATGDPDFHLVLGISGMLMYSMGVWPSADNVWTNGTQGGQERADPAYETLIAFLMGGPYGPGDMVGAMDRDLVMRTCRADGVLLRADKPLTHMDSTFLEIFKTGNAPNVWTTSSEVDGHRWTYMLGLNLHDTFTVASNDMRLGDNVTEYAVWEFWGGPQKGVAALTPSVTFMFPSCPEPTTTPKTLGHKYYVAAPILPYGWVLYGETAKIVTVSRVRVQSVATSPGALTLGVTVSAGEAYSFSYSVPQSHVVVGHQCSVALCTTGICSVTVVCTVSSCECKLN